MIRFESHPDEEINHMSLPSRNESASLLAQYIKNDALRHHCELVAASMEAYATTLGEDGELWYQAGLLHDLDWEMYPDQHPFKAVNEVLVDYPEVLRNAILAHGPELTGREPDAPIERYLYACDELSGFLHAYSLMRPEGFEGMKASKVKKKLKDKGFAAAVNRDDIQKGFDLIGVDPSEHIQFLITTFSAMSG